MNRLIALLFVAAVTCLGQEGQGQVQPAAEDSNETWRWINFVILTAGLIYLLVKTLPPFFQTRSESIRKDIAEARKLKQESDLRAAEIEKKVAGLGAEIAAFRKQSIEEMDREGDRIRQDTAAQIQKINDQAVVEIESASKAARRELRLYASNLSLDLAEKRVRERMDANSEAALIDNFVGDLKGQESKN